MSALCICDNDGGDYGFAGEKNSFDDNTYIRGGMRQPCLQDERAHPWLPPTACRLAMALWEETKYVLSRPAGMAVADLSGIPTYNPSVAKNLSSFMTCLPVGLRLQQLSQVWS